MALTDGRDDMRREGIADGKNEGDALGTSVGEEVGSAVTVSITTSLYGKTPKRVAFLSRRTQSLVMQKV